jgi:hypothetical protein
MSAFEDAQHEAAHVIVGTALGLTLKEATIYPEHPDFAGLALFRPTVRFEAYHIMVAAGIAWERMSGGRDSETDRRLLRSRRVRPATIETYVRAAESIIRRYPGIHARVTRALLHRPISSEDLSRIACGERLDPNE